MGIIIMYWCSTFYIVLLHPLSYLIFKTINTSWVTDLGQGLLPSTGGAKRNTAWCQPSKSPQPCKRDKPPKLQDSMITEDICTQQREVQRGSSWLPREAERASWSWYSCCILRDEQDWAMRRGERNFQQRNSNDKKPTLLIFKTWVTRRTKAKILKDMAPPTSQTLPLLIPSSHTCFHLT